MDAVGTGTGHLLSEKHMDTSITKFSLLYYTLQAIATVFFFLDSLITAPIVMHTGIT